MATLKNMLRRAWLVAVLAVLLGGLAGGPAQAQEAALDRVQVAFADGDADAVLADAADRVEIALLGQSKLYSRAQATYVMEDFFRRYPPDVFTLDNSAGDEANWFATGRYRYKHADKPLHVYLRLRQKAERWELLEVRVEQRRGE